MFTIWPSTVWTSVAQPTEQKGQTLGVTLALAIRSAAVCASTGWRLTPDAISPPSADAPLPANEKRRISRREIAMAETLSRIQQILACKNTPASPQRPRQLARSVNVRSGSPSGPEPQHDGCRSVAVDGFFG